jgi:hypothetical protein
MKPAKGILVARDLHTCIAEALGWSLVEVRSFSLATLRELVRPVRPELVEEISAAIASGTVIVGEPREGGP